jgi:hypothetical protein
VLTIMRGFRAFLGPATVVAYDLLRGIKVNAAFPPNPKAAVPN